MEKLESEEKIDFEKKKLINNINKRYGKSLVVQQYMREKRDSNVVIIAPTGSGKQKQHYIGLTEKRDFIHCRLKFLQMQ